METYFHASLEHLLAELNRIDLLIKICISQFSQLEKHDNPYPGMQITSKEIDNLLNRSSGLSHWLIDDSIQTKHRDKIADLRHKLDTKTLNTIQQGVFLRLVYLAQQFHLTVEEVDVLLICLAVEFDTRYQVFYAYLQDDVNKKQPTIELILNLLSDNLPEKIQLRRLFDHSSTLHKYKLIEVIENSGVALLSQAVKIDVRIANYLFEHDSMPIELVNILMLETPTKNLAKLLLPDDLKVKLTQFIQHAEAKQAIVYLQGKAGAGKQTLADAICSELKLPLLIADIAQLVSSAKFQDNIILIIREALLQNAAIYWKNIHILLEPDKQQWFSYLLQQLQQHKGLVFIASEQEWQWQHAISDKWLVPIKLSDLMTNERFTLWQAILPTTPAPILTEIAQRFKLTPGQIIAAANTAEQLSRWRNTIQPEVTSEDLFTACRSQANLRLATLAKQLKPVYQRSDLILPPNCQQQLDEIINYVKHYDKVYEQWGFHNKIGSNKGLNILFSGPPGTGKTMAAEVIANSLQLDAYKIDLSAIVSKYIGETEKNLNRIFAEAETSNAILFFDEADALFGKRSEVQDAHDRYANIETSYLLQKMEEYSGIVILATNFKRNMDNAFVRRLHFCVDFPLPNSEERLQIWKNIWPDKVPLNSEIDFSKLAKNLEITGANIRNIVLAAAFKAIEEADSYSKDNIQIDISHLMHSSRLEFSKMGKIIHENEIIKTFNNSKIESNL